MCYDWPAGPPPFRNITGFTMTLPMTPDSFEQLVGAAVASGDYKPVWRQFVRTRFLAPLVQAQNGAGEASELRVLPNQKDGKPMLLVAEEREKLALENSSDAQSLLGGEIVKKLPPGVAIGVVLSKGVFSIPANLVDWMRNSLQTSPAKKAQPEVKLPEVKPAQSKPPEPKPPEPKPQPDTGRFPELNLDFPSIGLPELPAAAAPASRMAEPAIPAPAAPKAPPETVPLPPPPASWDPDLVDLDLLSEQAAPPKAPPPPAAPKPAGPIPASSQWQLQSDDDTPAPANSASAGTKAGGKPVRKPPAKAGGPLDVEALKPRNVIHDGLGIDFYVPDAWQQRTGPKSLQFVDPATNTKIEVNGMQRADVSIEKWLEMRLPTVTKEMPFLKQVGDSWPVAGSGWRDRIDAMATEFQGTVHLDDEPTTYLICCYRTDSVLLTISVRVKSDVYESNRALYRWLFEQVDIREVMVAAVSGGNGRGAAGDTAGSDEPAPFLLGFSSKGRLGRMRFFAYSALIWVPIVLIILLMGKTMENHMVLAIILMFLGLVWMPLRLVAMRMHDFNLSGKWLLLGFLLSGVAGAMQRPDLASQVSVLFWLSMIPISLWPGDAHENNYGPPGGENPLWVKVCAGLFALLQVLAVVGAGKLMHDGKSLFAGRGAAETALQPFSPSDNSFTVSLPGVPREMTLPSARQPGVDDMHIYTLEAGNHKYFVQSIKLTNAPDDRNAALNRMRDNFIRNEQIVLVSESPVRIDEYAGRDFRLRLPNGALQDFRVLASGTRVYMLMIESPKDKESPAKIEAFMGSIHIN